MTGTSRCACGRVISGNKPGCAACLSKPVKSGNGVLEILNVQGGDVKITFDKGDPSELIRSKRIIEDMLRRGYALVVEVERGGERKYERVQKFDAEQGEYIIADLDPLAAKDADMTEGRLSAGQEERRAMYAKQYADDPSAENIAAALPTDPGLCHCGRPLGHRGAHAGPRTKRLPMEKTKATGIGRSAGG